MNLRQHYIVVIVTTATEEEAEKIARRLLDERLIACVNIIGPIRSLFWWAGNVEVAGEYLLLMKSRADLFEELSGAVKALHSYEVPEIIALPIIKGSQSYLKWLDVNLKPMGGSNSENPVAYT